VNCSDCQGVVSSACHPPIASPPNDSPAMLRSNTFDTGSKGDLKLEDEAESGGDAKVELDLDGALCVSAVIGVALRSSALGAGGGTVLAASSRCVGNVSGSSISDGRIVAVSEKAGVGAMMLSRKPGDRSLANGSLSSSSSAALWAAKSNGSEALASGIGWDSGSLGLEPNVFA